MMKIKTISQIIILLSVSFLVNSCKKDGFPVPPASTVPLYSYTIDNNGFAPATVTFVNESIVPATVGAASFTWSFGDGTSSSEESPAHTYTGPGVYSVKLNVKTSVSMEIRELSKDILILNANASGIPVYYTNGSAVYYGLVNSDKPVFSALPCGPLKDSYGLAFDTVNLKLYISDYEANKIIRCDADGKNQVEFRTGLAGPDGIAIDYENNMLYWDTNDGIQRADMLNTDVNQKEDFATGQSLLDPEGPAVDAINHKLYWTNYEDGGGIWVKNLDGTGEAQLLTGVAGGSTLVVGDRIFFDQFVATGDIHLKSANLDGSAVSTITTGITKVVFGIGYEPDGKKIYWGDRIAGKIMRANPDGSGIETWFTGTGSSPRGIVFGRKK
jgi:sugar lactone lactonase YvrE